MWPLLSDLLISLGLSYPSKLLSQGDTLKIKCCIVAFCVISIASLVLHFNSFRLDRHLGLCYREWPGYINGPAQVLVTAVVDFIAPSAAFVSTVFVPQSFCGKKNSMNTTFVVK